MCLIALFCFPSAVFSAEKQPAVAKAETRRVAQMHSSDNVSEWIWMSECMKAIQNNDRRKLPLSFPVKFCIRCLHEAFWFRFDSDICV